MEKTAEGLEEMLDGLSIQPPKLEDAGLEDCALPPHSIMEAFSRAANSLKSRIVPAQLQDADEDDDIGCIQDPAPTNGGIPDALLGSGDGSAEAPACGGTVIAGKVDEVGGDEVVVGGGEGGSDRVVVLGGDGKSCCPDEGGEAGVGAKEGDEEEEDEEKPILVESLI